jgi:hypothetical protein
LRRAHVVEDGLDDRRSVLFLSAEAMAFTCSAALRAVAALNLADHLRRPAAGGGGGREGPCAVLGGAMLTVECP